MRAKEIQSEQGQVLIQVAVTLVVLLAFAALAIDTGRLYAERRRMQNAADAGALAGARQLCLLEGQDAARAEAARYMQENGDAAVAAGDVTFPEPHIVRATSIQPTSTFLARIINPGDVDVTATAAAACGAANSACGLWPVAFEQAMWAGLSCGERFIVWNDENKEPTCRLPDENGVLQDHEDICDCYDCDEDNDGDDDIAVVTETSRGWLDISSAADAIFTDACTASGCGSSELACQLQNSSGARINLGENGICVAGARGVRAGVKDEVDARAGEAVSIPLYDTTNCGSDSNCTGTDAESYHIASFGCVTVDGWEQNYTLAPDDPADMENKQIKGKAIIVTINCNGECFTSCGGTTGEAPEPWEVKAVSLIE